jgi:hypothetical protein
VIKESEIIGVLPTPNSTEATSSVTPTPQSDLVKELDMVIGDAERNRRIYEEGGRR